MFFPEIVKELWGQNQFPLATARIPAREVILSYPTNNEEKMSNTTRRTALAILGLAPASALAGEDLSAKLDNGGAKLDGIQRPNSYTGFRFGIGDKTSAALRRLADDIDAHGSLVQAMNLNSKASHEDFLLHTLTIEFVVNELDADKRG
jgi:hypothetical protein